MNGFRWPNAPAFYVELGEQFLLVRHDERGSELLLERGPGGRLTEACKDRLAHRLLEFFRGRGWPRARVFCAISARGVSLRQLTLPEASRDDVPRLLRLQIETEFPLGPDELAWGWRPLGPAAQGGRRDFLVAAVKKEVLEDYADLFSRCGVVPVFTLAALARAALCPLGADRCLVLEVNRGHAELIAFEQGIPCALRVLRWAPGAGTDAAREDPGRRPASGVSEFSFAEVDALARLIQEQWSGTKVLVTARHLPLPAIARDLASRLGQGSEVIPVELPHVEGLSAANLGLRKSVEQGAREPLLVLQTKPTEGGMNLARPAPWKWAALAGGLALALLALPYAEALVLKPHLARQLNSLKADRGRLATVDRELDFLRYLKQKQPPYLHAVYLMSRSASPGTRLDAVTMNQRGEVSLRGSFRNPQQVVDFRSQLIESGFFSSVTVEEQAPTPDRQKVNVRMVGQWKQEAIPVLPVEPAPTNNIQATNAKPAAMKSTSSTSDRSGAPPR